MIDVKGENHRLGTTSFCVTTFNLWGHNYLDRRIDVLRRLFELRPPDLLAVQELKPELRDMLDEVLHTHDRVRDDFPGWAVHGNMWWRRDVFELLDHGTADIGLMPEHARLFWTRLRPTAAQAPAELLFATSHLTYQRHPQELADLRNRRVPQARRIVEVLASLSPEGAVIFTADMNDVAPAQLVFGQAGYLDTFTALGRATPTTHPVGPSSSMSGIWTPQNPLADISKGIDAVFVRGPLSVRASEVVEFYHDGRVASDHAPVTAMLTFDAP